MLKSVPDCYQNQKMCDKVVDTYPSTIEYVPDRLKTQEIIKPLINVILCLILFPINIRLKKSVVKSFLMILLS